MFALNPCMLYCLAFLKRTFKFHWRLTTKTMIQSQALDLELLKWSWREWKDPGCLLCVGCPTAVAPFEQGAEDKRVLSCLSKGDGKWLLRNSLSPGLAFFGSYTQLLKYSDKFGGHKTPACMTSFSSDKSNIFDDYRECQLIILQSNV